MCIVPSPARPGLAPGRSVLIIGAVLAGGASRRFHGDKAAVIGPRVVAALRAGGIDPVIAIGGTPDVVGVPTVADRHPGQGPLGAVATALTYARTGKVLVATCDLPLLDAASVRRIIDATSASDPDTATIAAIDGEPQLSLGCWPAHWASPIHRAVAGGERRFRHLLTFGPVELVEIDPVALTDADDRATFERLVGRHGGAEMPEPDGPSA